MFLERCCDGGEGQPLRKSLRGMDAFHLAKSLLFEVGYGMKCGTLVPAEKVRGLCDLKEL